MRAALGADWSMPAGGEAAAPVTASPGRGAGRSRRRADRQPGLGTSGAAGTRGGRAGLSSARELSCRSAPLCRVLAGVDPGLAGFRLEAEILNGNGVFVSQLSVVVAAACNLRL